MSASREHLVTSAFVAIANGMAAGGDVVDLLSDLTVRSAQVLDVASAGALLADARGELHVVAASSERTRNLELFQVQREQGPCRDCYLSGAAVSVPDLGAAHERWPAFVPAAIRGGFASVHAVPMRLRGETLGALGLFGTTVGSLTERDLELGQALADVASIVLVQERVASDKELVTQQLQTALDSRVVIEQAKGVLAQRGGLDMEQAFATLRRYARDHNLRLSELARSLVARELPIQAVVDYGGGRRSASVAAGNGDVAGLRE